MNGSEWIPLLGQGTLDTLYMVSVATVFTVLLGLPLGILLVITDKDGLSPLRWFNEVLGAVINAARSLPFIILLVIVIPITRAITGTTIGARAAIVPLSLAAIPFFARVAETSLREVDRGLVEAAQAMGCSPWQIVRKVLVPEALPSIILGIALTIISLIGYSAMAGAIGGGGLGDLAIRYGYQRYETSVMIATVILLIVLVQGIQWLGNDLARRISKK
jgi:D-methionine transport system permease protein